MSVENQVAIIFAGSEGFLDDIPVEKVGEFETGLLEYLESNYVTVLNSIRQTGELSEEKRDELKKATDEFKKGFVS